MTDAAARATWLGLGLSTNLSDGVPYAVLEADPEAFDYLEYSAPLSIEEARRDAPRFAELWSRRERTPALFHPVHLNLYGPELEPPEALEALDRHVREIGSPWVGNDVAWWHSGGEPFPGYLYVVPPLTEAGVADCARHALHVQRGLSVPLLLENPAVIALRGDLHVLDFMARLHRATGLGLILDVGHLLAHQLAAGLPEDAGLDPFPLEAVAELHVAGGAVTAAGDRRFYLDDHTQPVQDQALRLLERLLPRCPGLRAVTFEADGHPAEMARPMLRRLRALVPRRGPRPEERPAAPPPRPVAEEAWRTDPWALLADAYAGRGPDPAGARVELDYRLAVLAEQLDRAWPMSRPLLAGGREGLTAFAASPEFLDGFRERGGLRGAFARYARRALRERPEEGGAAALAFETWAHAALDRGTPEGTFPSDLSELWEAVKAVRRHALGRAWASGAVDPDCLDSLRQAARRAPATGWTVCLQRHAGRLEVRGRGR